MLLWMELSDLAVIVLPTVKDELLFKRPNPTKDERLLDGLFEQVWLETWAKPDSPYKHVTPTAEQNERAKDTLRAFTLRCFPKAPSKEAIARLPDAHMLAEAVAMQVEMVVTNNMASIDHTEVNALVRSVAASNENMLTNADDALLHAHVGAEGSRHLLTMFLAATWPEQGRRSMSMSDCREHLARFTQGLATGAAMPNCASKLNNAFVVDERLDTVISDAQTLAQGSHSLAIDNEHALTVERELAELRLAHPHIGRPHSIRESNRDQSHWSEGSRC